MTSYSDFSSKLLIALYQETELTGNPYQKVGPLLAKYGIYFKPLWISQVADEWEHVYFSDVSRVLNGYEDWAFRISAQGVREIESKYGDKDGVGQILPPVDDLTSEQDSDIAPASDRIVRLDHNQVATAEHAVSELLTAVEQDNGDSDQPGLRERIIGQIKAGRELLRAGEFRAYLLHEVLIRALGEIISRYKNQTIVALANALLGALVSQILQAG